MSATNLEVAVTDGIAPSKLFVPDGASEHRSVPLVVMYPDAFGPRPAIWSLGERLASEGYAVLQPDPFWRLRPYPPFDPETAFSTDAERTRILALLGKVSFDETLADVQATVQSLAGDPRLRTARLGTTGYCMGGRFSLLSAIRWPERVAAAASVHGGGLVTAKPDSPHLQLFPVEASLYFAVADNDASCTPEMQESLKMAVEAAGLPYQLDVFPGASHGFGVPGSSVYVPAAQEKAWVKTSALFDASLRG